MRGQRWRLLHRRTCRERWHGARVSRDPKGCWNQAPGGGQGASQRPGYRIAVAALRARAANTRATRARTHRRVLGLWGIAGWAPVLGDGVCRWRAVDDVGQIEVSRGAVAVVPSGLVDRAVRALAAGRAPRPETIERPGDGRWSAKAGRLWSVDRARRRPDGCSGWRADDAGLRQPRAARWGSGDGRQ